MTKNEQNQVRSLADHYLKSYRENIPARCNLVYIESPSGSTLRTSFTGSPLSDAERDSYDFAMRYLSRFDTLCQVLNLFAGTTYASLYDSFGIPCGGVA